jgi:hypothetical protein
MFLYREGITPEIKAAFEELRQLLGIRPGEGEIIVSYGFLPATDRAMAMTYKDYWFWVDDRDFKSKRAFTFLMILFSLTESGGQNSGIRAYPAVKPFRPEVKGFQLGSDQLRKRGAITFQRKKRQIFDTLEGGP